MPASGLIAPVTAVDFRAPRMLEALYELTAWRWLPKTAGVLDLARLLAETEAERRRHLIGRLVVALTGEARLFVFRDCYNLNLRELHERWYGEPKRGDVVRLLNLAVVGSTSTSAAFATGNWPSGVDLNVDNNGRIAGRGGAGGEAVADDGAENGGPGSPGGLALSVTAPVSLNNVNGTIAGGGGGGGGGGRYAAGGGGGGGGGAGSRPGSGGRANVVTAFVSYPGQDGADGTLTAGGAGGAPSAVTDAGAGGDGGDPGQPGNAGEDGGGTGAAFRSGGAGGAAGAAISGESDITWVDANGAPTANQGTIVGSTS